MFQYSKFEDGEVEVAISDKSSNSGVPATIKQKIKSLLRSKPIHVSDIFAYFSNIQM